MAKTEVILTHNIVGLGGESDHVKVAAGYARNFLFPRKLALAVTAENKKQIERERAESDEAGAGAACRPAPAASGHCRGCPAL